jgi:type IV secretion system protein TrbL
MSRAKVATALVLLLVLVLPAERAGAAPPGVLAGPELAPSAVLAGPGLAPSAVLAGPGLAPSAVLAGPGLAPPAGDPTSLGGEPCLPVVGCDPLGGLAQGAADAVGQAVFDALDHWVADGAATVLDRLSTAMTATTETHVKAGWFTDHFAVMRELAVVILLPLLMLGLISAVIHRSFGQLARAMGVFVPLAILGGAAAIELTDMALRVTDQLSASAAGDLGASTHNAIAALSAAARPLSTPLTAGTGGMLRVIVLLLVVAGAVVIWLELLLRSSAIYVVLLFLPLGLSGLVWPMTAHWTRRMIESLVALILSKFVIVAVIGLAAGMIAASSQGRAADRLDTLISGATLLLLAAFAPFAILRLVPLVEASVIGHLERLERRPLAAATQATTLAVSNVMGWVEGAAVAGGAAEGPAAIAPLTVGGQLNHVDVPSDEGGSRQREAAASPEPARSLPDE